MLKKLRLVAVVLVGMMIDPGVGVAQDTGLTSRQVFSLWTNINECLLASARVVSDDTLWRNRLAATAPATFEGKTSADVLTQMQVYGAKLNRLLRHTGLSPTERFDESYDSITPSVVYFSSRHVLNAQVKWLIRNTGAEQLVSQFYTRHHFSGKSPSDVYGLVELANRRLEQILTKDGV